VRGIERDVLPTAQSFAWAFIPWSPLAGGWLAGKFGEGKKNTSRRSARLPDRYDLDSPGNQRTRSGQSVDGLAEEAGVTLIELAIAFVLEHPASPRRLSDPGP